MAEAITELGDTELIKRINDEVGIDLAAERSTYSRAVALGEMLVLLRNRRNKKDGWQEYLREKCPKLAYETATLYIRLYEKQDAILAAAKAQSVTVTDLTVRLARKLIAKPGKAKGEGKTKKPSAVDELGNQPSAPSASPRDINDLDAGEIFAILKDDADKLSALYQLIHEHMGAKFKRRDLSPEAVAAASA
jgi:hypothetical protein